MLSLTWAQSHPSCGSSVRVPWRSLSCSEQERFLSACRALKDSGRWDELVYIHEASGAWGHEVPAFLLWHRWYMWVFERELQQISGSCLTIPFWDWDRYSSMATVFREDTFGTIFDTNGDEWACVTDGIARDWITAENWGNRCLLRAFNGEPNWDTESQLLTQIQTNPTFEVFSTEFEFGAHRQVHHWVGGAHAYWWAPDDPTFILHHSNVDRIFALWQNYHGHTTVASSDYTSVHYHDNLDSPLVIEAADVVNFDGPGRDRPPTPRELLSNQGEILNVVYNDDNLAMLLLELNGWNINLNWNIPGRAATVPRCQATIDAFTSTEDIVAVDENTVVKDEFADTSSVPILHISSEVSLVVAAEEEEAEKEEGDDHDIAHAAINDKPDHNSLVVGDGTTSATSSVNPDHDGLFDDEPLPRSSTGPQICLLSSLYKSLKRL